MLKRFDYASTPKTEEIEACLVVTNCRKFLFLMSYLEVYHEILIKYVRNR